MGSNSKTNKKSPAMGKVDTVILRRWRRVCQNYLPDRLLRMYFCDRLMDLSLRWMHPIQQHGRRIPSLSSETVRRTWSCLVSAVFTASTQQIHSLRASGVRLSHRPTAFVSASKAFLRSDGMACATPAESFLLAIKIFFNTVKRAYFPLDSQPCSPRSVSDNASTSVKVTVSCC